MVSRAILVPALSISVACAGPEAATSAGDGTTTRDDATAGTGPDSAATGMTATTATSMGSSATAVTTGTTTADDSSGDGSDSTGGGPPAGASDLPLPPGPDDLPAPDGTPGNLRVLPWAGFTAALSYTFDDGQPSHIAHWPALAATGARMTFYINTGNAGLEGFADTFGDVIAQGSEVANHTVHHCNYDQACGGAPAGSHDAEIDDADAYIIDTLGAPAVWTMAYPFGDTGYHDAAMARYLVARGTPGGRIAPSDDTDPWNLPTFAAQGGESEAVFDTVIDETRDAGEWTTVLLHSILPGDNWYAGVDIDAVTGSIAHAQALGDVWIDSVVRVAAYWRGQVVLEQATVSGAGDETVYTWTLPEHFPPDRHVRVVVDGGTLTQGGSALPWNGHGFYEVSLDAGELTLAP